MYDSSEDRKEYQRWGRSTVWIMAFGVVVLGIIFGVLQAGGKIFGTVLEREVFEQSYQVTAAEEERYNTLTAELEGVETRLRGTDLTDTQRADLEAHAAMLRVQIRQMGGAQ